MATILFRIQSSLLFLIAVVITAPAFALNIGDIVTKAGGSVGDGATAITAPLSQPPNVAVDNAGNIYIADQFNHRIRKVTLATGLITTVAGNGIASYAGDGGQATSASLNHPQSVALDSDGNIYIADYSNHRIRKVTVATGVITTVAGNGSPAYSGDGDQATNGSLKKPASVALDNAGNIYIADSYNNRIRKVTVATGVITTVAGNGIAAYGGDGDQATSANIYFPSSIALDNTGNIYIVDNQRIRKVVASTGIITTVAGGSNYGFVGDNGFATNARLNYPYGVTVDSSGNIYIADHDNQRIRKVTATTGIITTLAGNGSATFSGDNGPAANASLFYPSGVTVDTSGNIYIADSSNGRIRKVTVSTGYITTVAGSGSGIFFGDNGPATAAGLSPYGIAMDSSDNLYIAEQDSQRIRKVTAATGIITTVIGNGSSGFAGDGGQASNASLNGPSGVAIDGNYNIYIADQANKRIRKVNTVTGIITTLAGNGAATFSGDNGQATSAGLNYPQGVALDNNGNAYIADYLNNRIRKVAAATGVITTVAGNGTGTFAGDNGQATSASIYYPRNSALDSNGNIYIADTGNHRIRKVNAATRVITTVAGNGTGTFAGDNGLATSASLNNPTSVALDGAGNLYIADASNHRIRKVNVATGIITTVVGNGTGTFAGDSGPATSASIYSPQAVALDSIGNLYVADYSNHRIRKVYLNVVPTMATLATSSADNTAAVGDNVTFTAYVTSSDGVPSGTVTFMDGATTIGTAPLDTNSTASLTISSLAAGNHSITAVYEASGIYGASTTSSLVQTVLALPSVTTNPASSVTTSEAILNGTVNDNGAITNVSFEYGLTTGYGSIVSGGTVTAGSNATAVGAAISGLSSNTTYHFRAVGQSSAGTSYGNDATFITNASTWQLNVTIAGNGGGTVTSDPQGTNPVGIACTSGTCSTTFIDGTSVQLHPTANSTSTFEKWEGACTGSNACQVTMNAARDISATFSLVPKAKNITTGAPYATLADALRDALSDAELRLLDTSFTGSITLDKSLTLKGGWATTYQTLTGLLTILEGDLTIQSGDSTAENLAITGTLSIQGGSLILNAVVMK